MSVEYSVEVSDEEVNAQLEQIPENEIETALVESLERLAERDENIRQQQDGLQRRMGINPDSDDTEELSEAELKHETQRFLRGERRTDPRLEN